MSNTVKLTRSERIKSFLEQYSTEHIDVPYHIDPEDTNSFEDVVDQLDSASAFDIEIIYYSKAIEYLSENDPSLKNSLEIADEMGYTPKNLSSEILASLLASQEERERFMDNETEIQNFFDELNEEEEENEEEE